MAMLPSSGSFKNLFTWSEEGGGPGSSALSTTSWSDWVGEDDEDDPVNRPFSGTYTDDALAEGISGESPPIRAIDPGHVPRTDVSAEEFVLSKIGVTCMMDEHDWAKRVSSVQMPASAAGVKECDEIVAINGVDVSEQNVNSYECVEICNRAARHGSVVKLLVRDFITMKLKDVDVVVGDACPARKLARERGLESPMSPLIVAPRAPPVRWEEEESEEEEEVEVERGGGGDDAKSERSEGGRGEGSSMSQKKEKKQRKVWKGVMRWLALGVGWGLVLIFTVALFVLILTVNMEEERLTHVVEVANALERWLQTIPLCSCTYSSRGGTYFLPLCRACRPQVIWYENTNSAIGVGADRHRLCDYRPGWMLGTCQRSTESVKYLGRFGTSEECEAACLSYNVGTSVCRSFLYHRSSYPERRFRQSCFGTTHNGWDAQTEPEVDSGRVFGPLAQVQRMLVWYVRQVRQRIEARWWIDGRPWEVLVAVFVAVMIHAAIVTGVAQRRASNSTGSNGSKFPASPGLVLRSSSSPSLRLIPGLSSPSPSAPSRKNSSASSPVSPQVLMLSSGREHYRHKTGGGSPPYRSRAMKPPREREREPGNGAGAGGGAARGGEEENGALRLRAVQPRGHDAYHRQRSALAMPPLPPQVESLEEGRWL